MNNDEFKTVKIIAVTLGLCVFSSLLLIGLKIADVIEWHWMILISPILAPLVVIGMIVAIAGD